jgi:hypothetical protein
MSEPGQGSLRLGPGVLLTLSLVACTGPVPAPVPGGSPTPGTGVSPTTGLAAASLADPYGLLAQLLQRHVQGDGVDYEGLRGEAGLLEESLEALSRVEPSSLSRAEQLAFWINAYNACTLALIVRQPVTTGSIMDIPEGDRWKWRGWQLGGELVSLDHIEHEILRPMGEPRIHFAINCASRSCPPLAPRPYRGTQLEAQLDAATRAYLADPAHGLRLDAPAGSPPVLYLSRIFEWFAGDFEKVAGSVDGFVRRHAPAGVQETLAEHPDPLEVRYLEYDWSLNGQ